MITDLTKDILDLRIYNFIRDNINRHVSLYNFTEIHTGVSATHAYVRNNIEQAPWKVFTHNTIAIVNTKTITDDAYFIKMLTSLFDDVFKLENYVLKLNFFGDNCTEGLKQLTELLNMLSVTHMIDPTLKNPAGCSNQIVFQFSTRESGTASIFCTGSRSCIEKKIQEDVPSLEAIIDIEQLGLLIEKNLRKLPFPQEPALHIIIPSTDEQVPLALMLAYELQSHHYATDVLLEKAPRATLMNKANKMGAKFVLIIGPEEQQQGTVSVKHMTRGETSTVKQHDIASFLRS